MTSLQANLKQNLNWSSLTRRLTQHYQHKILRYHSPRTKTVYKTSKHFIKLFYVNKDYTGIRIFNVFWDIMMLNQLLN